MVKSARKGFTLIEILIVVAIIAILATVVLVGLGPSEEAGRDARRLSDIREVQNALELYFMKCGYYPGGAVPASCQGIPSPTRISTWSDLTTSLTGSNIGVPSLPVDPISTHSYYYGTTSDLSSYILAATLENDSNSVFNTYNANSFDFGNYQVTGISNCQLPNYCISL